MAYPRSRPPAGAIRVYVVFFRPYTGCPWDKRDLVYCGTSFDEATKVKDAHDQATKCKVEPRWAFKFGEAWHFVQANALNRPICGLPTELPAEPAPAVQPELAAPDLPTYEEATPP